MRVPICKAEDLPSSVVDSLALIATERVAARKHEFEGPLLGAGSNPSPEAYAEGIAKAIEWEFDNLADAARVQRAAEVAKRQEESPVIIAKAQDVEKPITLDDVIEMHDGQLIGTSKSGVRVYAVKSIEVGIDEDGEYLAASHEGIISGGNNAADLMSLLED